MNGVLVIIDRVRGQFHESAAEAVTAARSLADEGAGPITIVVLGGQSDGLDAALSYEGVSEIVHVRLPVDEFNVDAVVRALVPFVAQRAPRVVLAGMTVNATTFGPALAVRCGLGFLSDAVALGFEGGVLHADRPWYGGKVTAHLELDPAMSGVVLIRPGTWSASQLGSLVAVTEVEGEVGEAPMRVRHRAHVEPESSGVDIATADVILAIGRGLGDDKDAVEQVAALAERMGVTLAASRPLVDSGWLPKDRQVGQSGRTVKPKVYIALGISGAVQHLAGMKSSQVIVAVNTDGDAPIFQVAHHGAIVDLFDVVEELESRW